MNTVEDSKQISNRALNELAAGRFIPTLHQLTQLQELSAHLHMLSLETVSFQLEIACA